MDEIAFDIAGLLPEYDALQDRNRELTRQVEQLRALADEIRTVAFAEREPDCTADSLLEWLQSLFKEWPECSGDPASCPENEGYGCCKSAPPSSAPTDPGRADTGNEK